MGCQSVPPQLKKLNADNPVLKATTTLNTVMLGWTITAPACVVNAKVCPKLINYVHTIIYMANFKILFII